MDNNQNAILLIDTLLCLLSATVNRYWVYSLLLSTLCYWVYSLLLGLLSATGSTLCYWVYSLLLGLLSATGSTLCYWAYSLLLALPSAIPGYTLSTQDLAVPVIYSLSLCKV